MIQKLLSGIALSLALCFASTAYAQKKSSDATISGTVYDATGKPVAAAAVTCQSSAGFRPRVVHTDDKGHFRITGLKWDNYDLRATSKGAYSDWEKNILLHKGESKQYTLRLLNGNTALSGMLPAKEKPAPATNK